MDKDPLFQGTHRVPDALDRVRRRCLALEVVPVFVPPRETGCPAAIASFNGWGQLRLGARCRPATRETVTERSDRYVRAVRQQRAVRSEAAPPRRPFPEGRAGRAAGPGVFLRRTDEPDRVAVLGRRWCVALSGPHRRVRAEVERSAPRRRCDALRRRAPGAPPLRREEPSPLPHRRFRG